MCHSSGPDRVLQCKARWRSYFMVRRDQAGNSRLLLASKKPFDAPAPSHRQFL